MYDISDKRSAVKVIQNFLYKISENHVPLSGIYDENTKEAVVDFQRKNKLSQTGTVDKETLGLLFREYKFYNIQTPKNLTFPLAQGSCGEEIRKLNEKLGRLLDYYGVYHRLRPSQYFSSETALSVEKIRQIYNLENSFEIDKELYSRIDTDFKNIGDTEN